MSVTAADGAGALAAMPAVRASVGSVAGYTTAVKCVDEFVASSAGAAELNPVTYEDLPASVRCLMAPCLLFSAYMVDSTYMMATKLQYVRALLHMTSRMNKFKTFDDEFYNCLRSQKGRMRSWLTNMGNNLKGRCNLRRAIDAGEPVRREVCCRI